jgi:hypothetical protein
MWPALSRCRFLPFLSGSVRVGYARMSQQLQDGGTDVEPNQPAKTPDA